MTNLDDPMKRIARIALYFTTKTIPAFIFVDRVGAQYNYLY